MSAHICVDDLAAKLRRDPGRDAGARTNDTPVELTALEKALTGKPTVWRRLRQRLVRFFGGGREIENARARREARVEARRARFSR